MLSRIHLKLYVLFNFLFISFALKDRYRLPDSVVPKHYTLKFLPTLDNEFKYTATAQIIILCQNATKSITLHRDFGLKLNKIGVQKITNIQHPEPIENVTMKKILYSPREDFLMIYIQNELGKNNHYLLSIEFEGNISDTSSGFLKSNFTTKAGVSHYAISSFAPIGARNAFPCFDEPDLRATFNISIGRSENYNSTSNMPLSKTEAMEGKDGWYWDHYINFNSISTYLVSFIIYDNEFEWLGNPGGHFRILARKEICPHMDMIAETGPKLFEYLQKYFAMSLPFPKLDIVALPRIPGTAGSVSNPGMIVVQEKSLVYDAANAKQDTIQEILFSLAKQFTFQWLSIIAIKWWSEFWLKESLANYNSQIALDEMSGGHSSERELAEAILFFLHDGKGYSLSSVVLADSESIRRELYSIDHKKGVLILRMGQLLLGKENMKEIVESFLKKNSFQCVDRQDLWKVFETSISGSTIIQAVSFSHVMDTWTNQVGYPIVTVRRNYGENSAILTQTSFHETSDKRPPCWYIPITYTTETENRTMATKVRDWMKCPDESLEVGNFPSTDWLLVNLQFGSLFRVNYDIKNWKLLSSTLLDPKKLKNIPSLNRMQIIDDLFTFAYHKKMSYEFLFDLLMYLEYEKDYAPWAAVTQNMFRLQWRLHESAQVFKRLHEYMHHILGHHFNTKKLKVKEDSLIKLTTRVLLIECSCFFALEECINEVQIHFTKFKETRRSSAKKFIIPVELRDIVFCYAIKHGGVAEFDFLLKEWQNSEHILERKHMLNGLYCTNDVSLLGKIPKNKRIKRRIEFPGKQTQMSTASPKNRNRKEQKVKHSHGNSDKQTRARANENVNTLVQQKNESSNEQASSTQNGIEIESESTLTTVSDSTTVVTEETTPSAAITMNKNNSAGGISYDEKDSFNEPDFQFLLLRSKFEIVASVFYEKIGQLGLKETMRYMKEFTERISNEKDLDIFKKFTETHQDKFHSIQEFIAERTRAVENNLELQDDDIERIERALRKYKKFEKKKEQQKSDASLLIISNTVVVLFIIIANAIYLLRLCS